MWIFGIKLGEGKFDWKIAKALKKKTRNFQQESGIPDKVESELAAHAEEEGTERRILQVPEEGIHKVAERMKLLSRTVPFPLSLLLHTAPGERIPLYSP